MSRLFSDINEIDFELTSLPQQRLPKSVLMVSPDHFQVEYVINPHMEDHVGSVDTDAARAQWDTLRQAYESLELDVSVLQGAPGFPDMYLNESEAIISARLASYFELLGPMGSEKIRMSFDALSFIMNEQ